VPFSLDPCAMNRIVGHKRLNTHGCPVRVAPIDDLNRRKQGPNKRSD
jgi:hypothetical protein